MLNLAWKFLTPTAERGLKIEVKTGLKWGHFHICPGIGMKSFAGFHLSHSLKKVSMAIPGVLLKKGAFLPTTFFYIKI